MYFYHTLDNGFRIVFRPSTSNVAYAGVYIAVGSRHETGCDEGISHFIEHAIFKGTEHRRAYHILNRIDGVGGELNAFTTKEETCIYSTSLTEHLPRCLELFSDVLFHSVFPEKELEKEKEVVVEEINSYKDAPSDLIFDEFEELAYDGHPLAHNILGSRRNVQHFTSERVRAFVRQNYVPNRMVLSVVANVDFKRLVSWCQKYFSDYGSVSPTDAGSHASCPPLYRPFNVVRNRRTHQVHLLVGCPAPSLFDESRVPFTLLNNILGGPAMNSRLNVAVREKYGFCYTIESQFSLFTDAGLFYIYAGIDGDSEQQALELIRAELDRIATVPLTQYQLLAAQKQLIGQMAINNDSGLNEMQAVGKACLNYGRVDTLEDMSHDIMAISSEQLMEVAARCFAPSQFGCLAYH